MTFFNIKTTGSGHNFLSETEITGSGLFIVPNFEKTAKTTAEQFFTLLSFRLDSWGHDFFLRYRNHGVMTFFNLKITGSQRFVKITGSRLFSRVKSPSRLFIGPKFEKTAKPTENNFLHLFHSNGKVPEIPHFYQQKIIHRVENKMVGPERFELSTFAPPARIYE